MGDKLRKKICRQWPKGQRISGREWGTPSAPFSVRPPSGSHQRLTQEGAAMPCWGNRERLLFTPSAAGTTISHCTAQKYNAVQCSAVQNRAEQSRAERPILTRAGVPAAAPGPGAHTPTDQHRATSHSCWARLPRSSGNGIKEAENRELLSLEAS